MYYNVGCDPFYHHFTDLNTALVNLNILTTMHFQPNHGESGPICNECNMLPYECNNTEYRSTATARPDNQQLTNGSQNFISFLFVINFISFSWHDNEEEAAIKVVFPVLLL